MLDLNKIQRRLCLWAVAKNGLETLCSIAATAALVAWLIATIGLLIWTACKLAPLEEFIIGDSWLYFLSTVVYVIMIVVVFIASMWSYIQLFKGRYIHFKGHFNSEPEIYCNGERVMGPAMVWLCRFFYQLLAAKQAQRFKRIFNPPAEFLEYSNVCGPTNFFKPEFIRLVNEKLVSLAGIVFSKQNSTAKHQARKNFLQALTVAKAFNLPTIRLKDGELIWQLMVSFPNFQPFVPAYWSDMWPYIRDYDSVLDWKKRFETGEVNYRMCNIRDKFLELCDEIMPFESRSLLIGLLINGLDAQKLLPPKSWEKLEEAKALMNQWDEFIEELKKYPGFFKEVKSHLSPCDSMKTIFNQGDLEPNWWRRKEAPNQRFYRYNGSDAKLQNRLLDLAADNPQWYANVNTLKMLVEELSVSRINVTEGTW